MTPRLELQGFRVRYLSAQGAVTAVDGLDVQVAPGEAVGIFGESASGKSSLVKAAFGLLGSSAEVEGRAWLDGERIDGLEERAWRRLRGRRVGLVFQQPALALHPMKTVGRQLRTVLDVHRPAGREAQRRRAVELFAELDLGPEHLEARPHQLSGGQQQRVCLALALAGEPSLLVADEPTAALDRGTEAKILRLVDGLRRRRRLSLLWISHDPAVIEALCDRLYVIYAGRFVEAGPARQLLRRPAHPYLAALLACRPGGSETGDSEATHDRRLPTLPGDPPDPRLPAGGCRFAPRCAHRIADCASPPPAETRGARAVWCIRPLEGR